MICIRASLFFITFSREEAELGYSSDSEFAVIIVSSPASPEAAADVEAAAAFASHIAIAAAEEPTAGISSTVKNLLSFLELAECTTRNIL